MVGKPPIKHFLWGPRGEGIFSKPFPSETCSSNISHRWKWFKKKHPIPTSNLLLTSRFPPPQTKKKIHPTPLTYKKLYFQTTKSPDKNNTSKPNSPICCHPAIPSDHLKSPPWRFPMNIRELDLTVDTLDGGTELINQVGGNRDATEVSH